MNNLSAINKNYNTQTNAINFANNNVFPQGLTTHAEPDVFVTSNTKQDSVFFQKHWGKILVATLLVASACAYAFRGKLSKLFLRKTPLQTQVPKKMPSVNNPVTPKCTIELPSINQITTERITTGNNPLERMKSFNSNANYCTIGVNDKLKPLSSKFEVIPHTYNTQGQDIYFTSRTLRSDYPNSRFKLNGGSQTYLNKYPHLLPNVNSDLYHFGIGKTSNGRAFVSYVIPTNRTDSVSGNGRIIRECCTIISKNENFTETQIDLMKTLGNYTNNPNLHNGYFPMLSVGKEHIVTPKALPEFFTSFTHTPDKISTVAISEDVLLSNIQSWAKNTAIQKNKFLDAYKSLQNGQSIMEQLDGLVVENGKW